MKRYLRLLLLLAAGVLLVALWLRAAVPDFGAKDVLVLTLGSIGLITGLLRAHIDRTAPPEERARYR